MKRCRHFKWQAGRETKACVLLLAGELNSRRPQADCPKLQTCSIYSFQSQTLTSNTGRAAWHTFAAKFHQEASSQRITSWTSSPQAEQGSDSAEEAKETK